MTTKHDRTPTITLRRLGQLVSPPHTHNLCDPLADGGGLQVLAWSLDAADWSPERLADPTRVWLVPRPHDDPWGPICYEIRIGSAVADARPDWLALMGCSLDGPAEESTSGTHGASAWAYALPEIAAALRVAEGRQETHWTEPEHLNAG